MRYLRFDDKATRAIRLENDNLAAVSEMSNMINICLNEVYNPSEPLTVQDQLVRFFVRCPVRMYMLAKLTKYNIKFWLLCDSANRYCFKFQVYFGRAIGAASESHQGQRIVLEPTNDLDGGYNITVDNLFLLIFNFRNLFYAAQTL